MTRLQSSPDSAPAETLIHIADLHFWKVVYNPLRLLNKRIIGNLNVWLKRRQQYATDRADAFAAHIAACGTNQVVLTGDFASTSVEEEFSAGARFVRTLEDRGLRPVVMPGNHDVYTFESVRAKRFERHFSDWIPGSGYPACVTLANGTPLIVVPTACPNLFSSRGRITPGEIDAAGSLLRDAPEPLIVAGHYPLLDRTYAYRTAPNRQLENASLLRRMLGESGRRILYVAGHVHRFSYVRDVAYPNLSHLTSGALFYRNRGEDVAGDFSEIHVRADGFQVFRHVLRQDWSIEEADEHPAENA